MVKSTSVYNIHCPPARPTRAAAIVLATVLSVPVFAVLSLIDWLFL